MLPHSPRPTFSLVPRLRRPRRMMRETLLAAGVASAIALGLGGCNSTPPPTRSVESPDTEITAATADRLQVVTTFLPITQFAKAVAGDRANVVQLLPANVGPHDYQAKPDGIRAIAEANVLVQNGLELEFFLEDLIENADNADLAIIDSSEGIDARSSEEKDQSDEPAKEEDHDHEQAEGEEHAEGEDHEHEHAEGDSHHHGEFDPHIWLDPQRAIQQVENIRDGLIAADPEGEAEYTANAAAYIEQLEALDREIAEQLAPYAGQTFIAFHDFAFYFADRYNLNVEFLVDVPEENPSPEDVRRIIETAEAENAQALLTEPQVGEKAFAPLAEDLKVRTSVFDPLETGDTAASEPDYYFTIMRQNADRLEDALGESEQSRRVPWRVRPIAMEPQLVGVGF
ncbi:MAG: zinc ABC transporter substrate-binding protein [Cyanobacteriota bacterium]|nr:zinc ABC transporter substrate-binding protein [Cyanobacteriota bacterium]